jgi:hypothetical protein
VKREKYMGVFWGIGKGVGKAGDLVYTGKSSAYAKRLPRQVSIRIIVIN